jgi:hypothetical protein
LSRQSRAEVSDQMFVCMYVRTMQTECKIFDMLNARS